MLNKKKHNFEHAHLKMENIICDNSYMLIAGRWTGWQFKMCITNRNINLAAKTNKYPKILLYEYKISNDSKAIEYLMDDEPDSH